MRHGYRLQGGRLLPLCTLFLLGPGSPGRASIKALVDSGATYSIFHRSAAEDVGIKLPHEPNFVVQFGAERVPGWKQRVDIEMRGRRWKADVVFLDRLAYSYSLLGRIGVFSRFNEVSFVERQSPAFVEFRG
jgi:hypothetical protein